MFHVGDEIDITYYDYSSVGPGPVSTVGTVIDFDEGLLRVAIHSQEVVLNVRAPEGFVSAKVLKRAEGDPGPDDARELHQRRQDEADRALRELRAYGPKEGAE